MLLFALKETHKKDNKMVFVVVDMTLYHLQHMNNYFYLIHPYQGAHNSISIVLVC